MRLIVGMTGATGAPLGVELRGRYLMLKRIW
ncbi:Uncharacterised protein [Salmonella enterica subsp. enterica serovar Typhi]|nr:Uncharacterised protein [Salmonella enterica subsp. enterica serovar Typhi]CHF63156.1 Uncharacterised protein [Salmonella enterica subsp. enterica serovar Typhi]CHJ76919.1 Uncharacterised protein [Salmonella enterica subsp. enterica serovar Typhi]